MQVNQIVQVTVKVIKSGSNTRISFNAPGLPSDQLPSRYVLPVGNLEEGSFRLAFVPANMEDAVSTIPYTSTVTEFYAVVKAHRASLHSARLYPTHGQVISARATLENGFWSLAFPKTLPTTWPARAPKKYNADQKPAREAVVPIEANERDTLITARDLLNQAAAAGKVKLVVGPDGQMKLGVPSVAYL